MFTADQILATLQALLPIIAMLVAMPIFPQWTKDALAVAQAILNSDVLKSLLHTLLGEPTILNSSGDARTAAIHSALSSLATEHDKAAATAAGVDWTLVLKYLPQIITLVLSALGKRR